MKITVFTGNQPRHLSLIRDLAKIADQVYSVQECATVFPGKVDDFFRKTPVMQDYFSRVIAAEEEVFSGIRFSPENTVQLVIRLGDLNMVDLSVFEEALATDLFVVFGASFIKEPLLARLVEKNAINIHMGVSPYYRGNSCNFWALYDGNANLVGATIHRLSKALDSGGILFHALPKSGPVEPFLLGMQAVHAAHKALIKRIEAGDLLRLEPQNQDRNLEIRYTRIADFTDQIASEYLDRQIGAGDVGRMFENNPARKLFNAS